MFCHLSRSLRSETSIIIKSKFIVWPLFFHSLDNRHQRCVCVGEDWGRRSNDVDNYILQGVYAERNTEKEVLINISYTGIITIYIILFSFSFVLFSFVKNLFFSGDGWMVGLMVKAKQRARENKIQTASERQTGVNFNYFIHMYGNVYYYYRCCCCCRRRCHKNSLIYHLERHEE